MKTDPSRTRRIGLSLGDTENLRDGLGEFSIQLGQRIAARAPELKQQHGIEVFFHLRDSLNGIFGSNVSYLRVTKNQRWFHRQDQKFDLWHNFHQLNRTRPPLGTTHRLVTVHDLNFLYFKSGYSLWRDTRRMRRTLRQMTQLIAISNYVKNDFIQKMEWKRNIEVIYNGARDLSGIEKKPIQDWNEKPFIFHLSRMAKSKNVAAILGLAKSWPDMNFILAGPKSSDSDQVTSILQEMGLKNARIITDIEDSEKAWLFNQCIAFIFPSFTEGFGLPPIEAMHFGKPVFLSNLTSLPEIGGSNAMYFIDFSPEGMRKVVSSGIEKMKSHNKIIKEHAKQFNWDNCASNYISKYIEILKSDFTN
jgi:glycosyltransferase involved in cell wall biosynthesis